MNCDPIARWYRWLEYGAFGRALERRREQFLPDAADARRVLALGDGDGRALVKLLEAAPRARVDYVDLSARMLDLARARVRESDGTGAGSDRVAFHCADALGIRLPEAEYDLIVSHFFLDCLDSAQMESLVRRVVDAARPEARWIVSEFREPRAWARWIIRGLYLFFRISTGLGATRLVDHRAVFARRGFRAIRMQPACAGLLASELWVRGDAPAQNANAGSAASTEPHGNAAAHAESDQPPGTYRIGGSLGKYTA